ncbi:MAG: glutamate--tRNA ligase family protein, partial [Paraperlucidibaca sp.]
RALSHTPWRLADPGRGRLQRAHGLHWDGDIVWQSQRIVRYRAVLAELIARDLVYASDCSRAARAETGALDCLGPCRLGEHTPASGDTAWRLRAPSGSTRYHDRLRGELHEQLTHSCGDAVLWRRDDLPAYQLATVVDDYDMAISEVVRGSDLLDNSARQCHLIDSLGWPRPEFLHIPTLLNDAGQKLSKQSHALALDSDDAAGNLFLALQLLAQQPPAALQGAPVPEIVHWAVTHWRENALPIGDITQS